MSHETSQEKFFEALLEGRVVLQHLYDVERNEPSSTHVFATKGAIPFDIGLGDLQILVLPDANYDDPEAVIDQMNRENGLQNALRAPKIR